MRSGETRKLEQSELKYFYEINKNKDEDRIKLLAEDTKYTLLDIDQNLKNDISIIFKKIAGLKYKSGNIARIKRTILEDDKGFSPKQNEQILTYWESGIVFDTHFDANFEKEFTYKIINKIIELENNKYIDDSYNETYKDKNFNLLNNFFIADTKIQYKKINNIIQGDKDNEVAKIIVDVLTSIRRLHYKKIIERLNNLKPVKNSRYVIAYLISKLFQIDYQDYAILGSDYYNDFLVFVDEIESTFVEELEGVKIDELDKEKIVSKLDIENNEKKLLNMPKFLKQDGIEILSLLYDEICKCYKNNYKKYTKRIEQNMLKRFKHIIYDLESPYKDINNVKNKSKEPPYPTLRELAYVLRMPRDEYEEFNIAIFGNREIDILDYNSLMIQITLTAGENSIENYYDLEEKFREIYPEKEIPTSINIRDEFKKALLDYNSQNITNEKKTEIREYIKKIAEVDWKVNNKRIEQRKIKNFAKLLKGENKEDIKLCFENIAKSEINEKAEFLEILNNDSKLKQTSKDQILHMFDNGELKKLCKIYQNYNYNSTEKKDINKRKDIFFNCKLSAPRTIHQLEDKKELNKTDLRYIVLNSDITLEEYEDLKETFFEIPDMMDLDEAILYMVLMDKAQINKDKVLVQQIRDEKLTNAIRILGMKKGGNSGDITERTDAIRNNFREFLNDNSNLIAESFEKGFICDEIDKLVEECAHKRRFTRTPEYLYRALYKKIKDTTDDLYKGDGKVLKENFIKTIYSDVKKKGKKGLHDIGEADGFLNSEVFKDTIIEEPKILFDGRDIKPSKLRNQILTLFFIDYACLQVQEVQNVSFRSFERAFNKLLDEQNINLLSPIDLNNRIDRFYAILLYTVEPYVILQEIWKMKIQDC